MTHEESLAYLQRRLEIFSAACKLPSSKSIHSEFWIEASAEIAKIENSNRHQKCETDCSVQRQTQGQDRTCK